MRSSCAVSFTFTSFRRGRCACFYCGSRSSMQPFTNSTLPRFGNPKSAVTAGSVSAVAQKLGERGSSCCHLAVHKFEVAALAFTSVVTPPLFQPEALRHLFGVCFSSPTVLRQLLSIRFGSYLGASGTHSACGNYSIRPAAQRAKTAIFAIF